MLRATVATAVLAASVVNAAPIQSSGDTLPIATFDGSTSSKLTWMTENDPVMGGQSVSTFKVDQAAKVGVWAGQVKVVPFLHAAGFCTLRGTGDIPSLSDYSAVQVTLERGAATNLTNFQVQFTSTITGPNPRGGEFIANFNLTSSSSERQTVTIPFAQFVESWRGMRVGGAPTVAQLGSIKMMGLGTDGVAGMFSVNVVSIVAVKNAIKMHSTAAEPTTLVSFAAGDEHNYKWFVVNDPVMGGLSRSTIIDSTGVGIFNGTVRIVPSLKAPGFCNAEARPGLLEKKIPDVSSYLVGGGIRYTIKSTGPLHSFKAAFGTSLQFDFNSYKADFVVPNSGNFEEIFIPFTNFSNKWSAATGEPTMTCAEHPEVCPTAKSLSDIGSVGIWAEGAAGDFHVEMKEIAAAMAP
eukprot:m.159201 g.159201  ORF g.159201 m.159201 type:complete len:408 (+) comp11751_c0_seq1:56-1279(+)